ncbi:peptidoglycan-binding protein [Calothrix sp. UHCC 0171]|uniref:peptidoglycan-binding domain-containing protein n=1 Tax=Calothrix sp. UHCC 0171 TaxID=3110245 RepID=UPI002B204F6D|nr:peptidoglycan-binding protein [Calothrix sp. UHCC 0171]MEA5571950.1 peptidoglycan-binding protein [Calothrix sp. UHCC 0171]
MSAVTEPTLKQGSSGEPVKELQRLLARLSYAPGQADGIFGSHTTEAVKKFQQAESLVADGIVGPKTWEVLYNRTSQGSTSSRPMLSIGSTGDAVRNLQSALKASGDYTGQVDGSFGSNTETAVKKFQSRVDLVADGIVGERTWNKVDQIAA